MQIIQKAVIAIEISCPKEEERLHYYNQFVSLKKLLASITTFNWQWNETFQSNHKTISSILKQIDNINILNQSDWPGIISFLKPHIIALDQFWNMVKDEFITAIPIAIGTNATKALIEC